MKTHSGAKKRFKLTASGKLRGRHAFTSHMLEHKSPKHKRALGRPMIVAADDVPRIRRMLAVPSKATAAGPAKRRKGAGPAKGRKGRSS